MEKEIFSSCNILYNQKSTLESYTLQTEVISFEGRPKAKKAKLPLREGIDARMYNSTCCNYAKSHLVVDKFVVLEC